MDTDAVAETAFETTVPIITVTDLKSLKVSLHTGLGCEIQPYFILITSKSTYRVTQEMGTPSELKGGNLQQIGAMDWSQGGEKIYEQLQL